MKDDEKDITSPFWIAHKQQFFSTIISSKESFDKVIISSKKPDNDE